MAVQEHPGKISEAVPDVYIWYILFARIVEGEITSMAAFRKHYNAAVYSFKDDIRYIPDEEINDRGRFAR